MARIKIEDLTGDIEIGKKELRKVAGGIIGSIYVMRIDKDGHVYVQFGDGKSGARLPTDSCNITAAYGTTPKYK